jgi:putative endonuclease
MNPVRPVWFYTYVLKNQIDNTFYTGVTTDLKKRLDEHNKGLVTSTKHRRPLQLIYYEACLNKGDAYRREKYLKTGMGKRYLKNRLKGILQQDSLNKGGLTG